jgi:hypothetical protein
VKITPATIPEMLLIEPDVGIKWPGGDLLISEKDVKKRRIKVTSDFLPVYEANA